MHASQGSSHSIISSFNSSVAAEAASLSSTRRTCRTATCMGGEATERHQEQARPLPPTPAHLLLEGPHCHVRRANSCPCLLHVHRSALERRRCIVHLRADKRLRWAVTVARSMNLA